MSAAMYFAQYNDIVTLKPAYDTRRQFTGVLFRVEALTKGKLPVIVAAADGRTLKVHDDMLEPYTAPDRDEQAARFPDNGLLPAGTILRFEQGTGTSGPEVLWCVLDRAASGMYSIAPLGGGGLGRRGYLRHQLTPISLAAAAAHLAA
ncbi:hypothetical protein [Longispora albida]|uniref:hypothetical protein n=1 Tax=Longispora albida TaxID=203523 RepID=UPI00039A7C2A|nr:hypothetical protein [Longispora albida]